METITLTLPEKFTKQQAFETVAISHWWAPTIEVGVQKEMIVEWPENYESNYTELSKRKWFVWIGAFYIDDTSERHTWTETETQDNISMEEFGAKTFAKFSVDFIKECLEKIDTPEEIELKRLQEEKRAASEEVMKNIEVTVS